jgi:thiol:disulfide interchange protein DsbD
MKFGFWAVILLVAFSSSAQNPVSWKFSAKKKGDKVYEIHIAAKVDYPWHIYSQTTPEGGPVPTKITFSKNPLITNNGGIKEEGKVQTKHEEVFGVDVKYFDGAVDFVQVVKLKSNVKTNLTGSVQYMVCNDQQCLPPATVTFNILLQ